MVLDSESAKVLGDLKRKRGVIKAALTRASNFTNTFDPKTEAISLLVFRQEELPHINRKFDEVQVEIELLDVDGAEEAEHERDEFERKYFAIRSQIQEILNNVKHNDISGNNVSLNTTLSGARARLAPIDLPKFNGNIREWESFYDCFKVMVHQEDYYSPSQKFHYLRSTLSGQALDLIKSLPMNDANYIVALTTLQQRYDNRSLVIQSHIRELLNSPRITAASSQELFNLHSHVTAHVAALHALNQPILHWDAWLVTIIVERMDHVTAHEWQLRRPDTELPSYTEVMEFLSSRCIAFESSEALSNRVSIDKDCQYNKALNAKRSTDKGYLKRTLFAANDSFDQKCACCSSTHKLFSCTKFKELSVSDRLNLVRDAKLCFNCLYPYHTVNKCRSRYSCQTCKGRHNSLLHLDNPNDVTISAQSNDHGDNPTSSSSQTSKAALLVQQGLGHVFLATAKVLLKDNCGGYRSCRAVLDSGSQLNFISRKLVRQLQLPPVESALPISGIGASTIQSSASVNVQVESMFGNCSFTLACQILPIIVPQLTPVEAPSGGWSIPNDLLTKLADPNFFESRQIDLLIGGGVFFELLQPNRRQLDVSTLYLQDSKLGWIVTGEIGLMSLVGIHSVGKSLEEDWKATMGSEILSPDRSSKANQKCIEEEQTVRHFEQTTCRDNEGRFIVRLPKRDTVNELGLSVTMATNRFISVERRLRHNESLRMEYTKFMKEYEEMGHMKEVIEEMSIPQPSFYLPHHAVLKSSSLTTKVRVVFDASAKSSSGLSLNNVLKNGPTVQEDVFAILTRFRKHQYVITADIEKMFRQVRVAEDDWNLQRIVWRQNPEETLRTYQLTTVTYGTTPASFLATQCLVALAEEVKQQYPEASRAIRHDFYMDDLMTGADKIKACCKIQKEINTVLNSAKLPLRKWCSNSRDITKEMGSREGDPLFTLKIGDGDTIKSLGLEWKPVLDQFVFSISPTLQRNKLTKRMILSDLNKIFDPLGFLAPVLIRGKIFLQQMWAEKMAWDNPLPTEMQIKWVNFYHSLTRLKELRIQRKVIPSLSKEVEVHGFCDASEEAYGACVYIRSKDESGTWNSRLLCAKTRVAPLKGNTIPRLELNGALLLAELVKKVAESWDIETECYRLWTDSMVVLSWINSQKIRLKTYVLNRVTQILELTEVSQWKHVRTLENSADVLSRGISPEELLESELWWKGPNWLMTDENTWRPYVHKVLEESELPERKNIKLVLVVSNYPNKIIQYYSEWNRLKRGVAWFLRFIKYLKDKKVVSRMPYNSESELKEAERWILKRVQFEVFSDEVRALRENKELPSQSKLKCLNAYMKNGLILVGGRLNNSNLLENQKHPIVLPVNHKVTQLIFKQIHKEQLHCGPQALLAEVRRRYWPLRGRAVARSNVLKCVKCTRAKPRFTEPMMAALPRQRVQCSRPFTVTGVDFAGPLIIRSGLRRVVGVKAWIAVFVCFVTRAIHLEVVEDLTSKAFIACLRRFMSRRGCCKTIFSDNGTNFIGAQRELKSYITNAGLVMAQEGIEWRFNPPAAPHFGGLWESAVKSAKHHLSRIMGEAKLTMSELNTLLCQIEACLNSRPITPMSSDPSDAEALTPAHFLIGGAISLPPEPQLSHDNPGYLRRWKYVQLLMQTFWRRWQLEYLPQLQVRGKWVTKSKPIQINDIVIIKDEVMPPTRWKLGRVTKVHPGSDNVIRVVTVRTASGSEMKRPTVKLCVLPTEADSIVVETL